METPKEGIAEPDITIFDPQDYYWNQIPLELLQKMLSQIECNPSKLREIFKLCVAPQVYKNAFELIRANILPSEINCASKIGLEIGSSWGGVSFQIAPRYQQFYCADLSLNMLKFLRFRKWVEKAHNIRLFKIGTLESGKIPFEDSSVDHIFLIGVLEWVGSQETRLSPRDYQILVLKELRRLLKPDGRIFVGIENRIGFDFFAGALDHCGLRYTTLMPRWLASLMVKLNAKKHDQNEFRTFRAKDGACTLEGEAALSRAPGGLVRGREFHNWNGFQFGTTIKEYEKFLLEKASYRTFTYSIAGYAKLFDRSGYEIRSIRLPIPNYRYPQHVMKASDAEISKILMAHYENVVLWNTSRWQKIVLTVLLNCIRTLSIEPVFAHSYLFELAIKD